MPAAATVDTALSCAAACKTKPWPLQQCAARWEPSSDVGGPSVPASCYQAPARRDAVSHACTELADVKMLLTQ